MSKIINLIIMHMSFPESSHVLLCFARAPNLQNSIMKEPTATPSILGERETRWSGEIIAFV